MGKLTSLMNRRIYFYWAISLLLIAIASIILAKSWLFKNDGSMMDSTSIVATISARQSMGNDIKWTRCFRDAGGTIFFEDHRMSTDGGKTVVDQYDIDVEEINAAPERAVLIKDDLLYALDGPTRIIAPGVYSGKVWRSSDGLQTIQEEQATFHVPEGPLRDRKGGEWYGLFVYRTIIEMPDGTWCMTMYGNFATDTIVPPNADAQKELSYMERTILVTSSDQGRNWHYLSTIASPQRGDAVGEGFVEPALTLLKDGRLLCIMRSGHHYPLYASWSEDNGKSWSPPMYTGLDRGCDPCLITLQDGRVALSWGRRFPEGWSTISPEGDKGRFEFPGYGYTTLSISEDGGVTWTGQKIMKRAGTCYSTIMEVEPNVVFLLVDEWHCRINLNQRASSVSHGLVENIKFAQVINHKGNEEDLLLDVYMPDNDQKANHEVILWVHGGGFRGGDKRQGYIVTLCRAFAEKGYVCIAPDYRLRGDPRADYQGTVDDAVSDIHIALDWVIGHGKEFGYDPKKIIVGGGSAGGILMNKLCFQEEKERHNRRIRAFVNLWGSPDNEALFNGIKSHDPPTLIIHGMNDELVPFRNSELLSKGLENAGVYHELHAFAESGHTPIDRMEEIIGHVTAFLENPATK